MFLDSGLASANEGAKFWLQVLTEIRNRGVKDIFIAMSTGAQAHIQQFHRVGRVDHLADLGREGEERQVTLNCVFLSRNDKIPLDFSLRKRGGKADWELILSSCGYSFIPGRKECRFRQPL